MSASLGRLVSPARQVFRFEPQGAVADSPARGASQAQGKPVQRLSPIMDERWDSRLGGGADCSFFHGKAWAAVLAQTYGYKPHYFAVRAGETLDALLPMMEVDSWLTGRRCQGFVAALQQVPFGQSLEVQFNPLRLGQG